MAALLIFGTWSPIAATPAEVAFDAAAKAFQDGFFARAEAQFGELAAQQPEFERRAEAVLWQAQARFRLGLAKEEERKPEEAIPLFNGAIELLNANLPKAGVLADRYRYWLAQAHLKKGDYAASAALFEQLLKDFPESTQRLEAAYGQAYARFKAGDLPGTIQLMQDPAGPFQSALKTSTNHTLAARGYLLLGEALRAQRDYKAAEEVLQQLAGKSPGSEIEWQAQYRLARIEMADGRPEAALQRATNLANLPASASEPVLRAQAHRLEAEILEKSQPAAAIRAYEKIALLPGAPAQEHRQALLRMMELAADPLQITNVIERFRGFIAQNPQDVALDLLHLTIGELYLKQYYALSKEPSLDFEQRNAGLSNCLQTAKGELDVVLKGFTNSAYAGKALLNQGWCLWEEGLWRGDPAKIAESQNAFQAAAERLPKSEDQALARLKWADAQFQQKNFAGAVTNYSQVAEGYADLPRVKERFGEQSLHKLSLAHLELGQWPQAKKAALQLLELFPKSPLAEASLFSLGQRLLRIGRPAESREFIDKLIAQFPNSTRIAEAQLILAQTYVEESNWTSALAQYESWLAAHANHPVRPQALFDQAWTLFRSGNETNAVKLWTNFVAAFPTNDLAPLAQFCVAEHFFRKGDFSGAELNYQSKVLQSPTNSPHFELGYRARLMAGWSAFKREGFANARGYLTNMIEDASCPASIVPEVLLLMGEVLIAEEPVTSPTNALLNFERALNSFNRITNQFPTSRIAPIACGRAGDCHLQLAALDSKRYAHAAVAYQMVVDSPLADVRSRSKAEVGLAIVLEKQAASATGPGKTALLEQALNHYLNVVYGNRLRVDKGERSDPFWIKEAGLAAGRLAESLNKKVQALELYKRLLDILPAMRETWQKKRDALGERPSLSR